MTYPIWVPLIHVMSYLSLFKRERTNRKVELPRVGSFIAAHAPGAEPTGGATVSGQRQPSIPSKWRTAR